MMRLLRDDSVEVRFLDGDALDEWRSKVVGHLNSSDRADRGRYRYETDWATTKGIDSVSPDERVGEDTAVLERAEPQKPLEGREVVELMAKEIADQWLTWKRTNPALFRRKIEEAMEFAGWGHMTVEQASEQVYQLCRKLEEAEAAETFKKRDLGGGFRGAVILS